MKRNLIALLLIGMFVAPMAQAEGTYAGIVYGQVESDDLDFKTGNLGFTIGSAPEQGFGFEFFYAKTVNEDEITAGPFEVEIAMDTYGILGLYKTAGDIYFKAKAGYAVVDLELDFKDLGSVDDTSSGLAFGLALGFRLGAGGLELAYTVLPEFDEFQDIDVDADVEMISLGYNWDF